LVYCSELLGLIFVKNKTRTKQRQKRKKKRPCTEA